MSDPFADAAADILASVGVSATFKPQSGDNVATRVHRSSEVDVGAGPARSVEERSVLLCERADVGIPSVGDVFEVDETDYIVDGYPDDGAGNEYLIRVIVR